MGLILLLTLCPYFHGQGELVLFFWGPWLVFGPVG